MGESSDNSFFGHIYTELPVGIGFRTEQKGRVWEAVKLGENKDGETVVDFRPVKNE